MKDRWRILEEKFIYKSENIEDEISIRRDLVEPPSGKPFRYVYVDCPYQVVFTIGVREDGNILLIRQYRFLFSEWLWEVPAGSPSHDESLEQAAKREFEEESGYSVGSIRHIFEFYPSVGITNQRCHIFEARDLKKGMITHDIGEDISDVRFFTPKEIIRMMESGKIKNSGAVIGLMALLREPIKL